MDRVTRRGSAPVLDESLGPGRFYFRIPVVEKKPILLGGEILPRNNLFGKKRDLAVKK
jgi:hypothetical protein